MVGTSWEQGWQLFLLEMVGFGSDFVEDGDDLVGVTSDLAGYSDELVNINDDLVRFSEDLVGVSDDLVGFSGMVVSVCLSSFPARYRMGKPGRLKRWCQFR